MADHRAPDYELAETLSIEAPDQFKALFEVTRRQILQLLLERAATISELAATLDIPKGTIGHHIGVLEETGLIRVVRTKKVRAIEAKYYGRTARTFILTSKVDSGVEISPDFFITTAAAEFAESTGARPEDVETTMSTLRYARIPDQIATEWVLRLGELTHEFTAEGRGGETTYGMLVAFYPTNRPHLPDIEDGK
ncbi:MAG TPA: winged helix-turn-helix domain-containing protein [Acidimicrobiia bacterium]|nr:winged helix-turn-helix domain-containing protein [Acidimicrobiia bacterium]